MWAWSWAEPLQQMAALHSNGCRVDTTDATHGLFLGL